MKILEITMDECSNIRANGLSGEIKSKLMSAGFNLEQEINIYEKPEVSLLFVQKNMGCEYCNEGTAISPKNREELGIELHSGSGHLVAYGKDKNGWDISVSVPIKFCPICGRDLR